MERGRTSPPTTLTERGYTDHHANRDIGLTYMNARYYVPGLGRFLTADTLVPSPTNPQSHNRYSYVLGNPLVLVDPTGHASCYTHGQNEHCTDGPPITPTPHPPKKSLQHVRREIKSGIPAFIRNATPFTTLPYTPAAYTGGGVQGFGDTQFASDNQWLYGFSGRLHAGADIPMDAGTELLALGYGVVVCGTKPDEDTFCGQTAGSGGFGIGIRYDACSCIVYYAHATNVMAEGTRVSAGDVVALSGASNGGYEHLHLEIRSLDNTMVYNPIYFFSPDTWTSMNLTYMGYGNSYANPQTRIYAVQTQSGHNYWQGPPYPRVWVRIE